MRRSLKPLTLDEILQDLKVVPLQNTLIGVMWNTEVPKTSWSTQILPASEALYRWLERFEENMRPEYATRVKVCYAERGFTLFLDLLDAIDDQIRRDEREVLIPDDDMMDMSEMPKAREFRDEILGQMAIWLSTLTDLIPVRYRSPLTPFTSENKARINQLFI